jgi:hypothetical protein
MGICASKEPPRVVTTPKNNPNIKTPTLPVAVVEPPQQKQKKTKTHRIVTETHRLGTKNSPETTIIDTNLKLNSNSIELNTSTTLSARELAAQAAESRQQQQQQQGGKLSSKLNADRRKTSKQLALDTYQEKTNK